MNGKICFKFLAGAALAVLGVTACAPLSSGAEPIAVAPAKMPRLGSVDERFQSFNVEMVEVTGGRFWAPYSKSNDAASDAAPAAGLSAPAIDPAAFRNRPPIDLASPRLRKLAAALGPAFVRISGTWANSTYFHDSDTPAPATPPPGFGGVLTRAQWLGVFELPHAPRANIATPFPLTISERDAY